jgi:low affinity Fe/Cu permease
MKNPNVFEQIAYKAMNFTGTTAAFIGSVAIILIWVITGPLFDFSDTWQLVINTGTTIVTFLMVFLIQRAQNKDSKALHLKLDELICALENASNKLIDIEDGTEEDLNKLAKHYHKLSTLKEKQEEKEEELEEIKAQKEEVQQRLSEQEQDS